MKSVFIYFTALIGICSMYAKTTLQASEDCDVCSTSTSSTSINFDFNSRNYIGLYTLYQNYKTYNGIFKNSKQFKEHYRTLQLSGNYMISPRWNVTLSMPIHIHNRVLEDQSIKQNESGLGDISLQSTYQILKSDSTQKTNWSLNFGGGIKTPTAKFENRDGQGSNPNFNLGSGSWDYSLTTLFNIKGKQAGINTQLTYTFKSENKSSFKFGNQTDVSILYYKTINPLKNQPFNLFAGIKSEFYDNNQQYGYRINHSKGFIHQIQIGGNLPLKTINLGCMAYIPIKQNLMDKRIHGHFKALFYIKINL